MFIVLNSATKEFVAIADIVRVEPVTADDPSMGSLVYLRGDPVPVDSPKTTEQLLNCIMSKSNGTKIAA